MATRKRMARDDGGDDGGDDGRNDGNQAMLFDDFLVALAAQRDKLMDAVGLSNGGYALKPIDLDPLESLGERIEKRYPGRVRLLLRAKRKNGTVAFSGIHQYDTTQDGAATTGKAVSAETAAMLALANALTDQLKQTNARLDAMQANAAAATVQKTAGDVDGVERIAKIVKELQPAQPQVLAPSQVLPPAASLRDQLADLKTIKDFAVDTLGLAPKAASESVGIKALELFAPSGNQLILATSALLVKKAGLGAEEKKDGGDKS